VRIERRLAQPRWLSVVVPIFSVAFAFGVIAVLLVATGHDPGHTYAKLFQSAFSDTGALSATLVSATPLAFTGLAAAAAFRMNLFNIGAEGQLYFGVVGSVAAALLISGAPGSVQIAAMCLGGLLGGAVWGLIPGVLRAFGRTNEIITSLMLNYVALLIINYLIFDSHSYWRDTESPEAAVFPQGKLIPEAANWPLTTITDAAGGIVLPLGFVLAAGVAFLVWTLYRHTRFGFELQVIADSPRAAHYAGMRTRRKILAVMGLSGAIAGLGGAAQAGNFDHQLDPRGLEQSFYGYTGIVVAALARYNPVAVVLVAFLLGGLRNAGFALQGADFPSGLVGVMQGIFLFCVLGGEILIRYRIRIPRWSRSSGASGPPAVEAAQ
jgi:general nucleoside transport system permease protein